MVVNDGANVKQALAVPTTPKGRHGKTSVIIVILIYIFSKSRYHGRERNRNMFVTENDYTPWIGLGRTGELEDWCIIKKESEKGEKGVVFISLVGGSF